MHFLSGNKSIPFVLFCWISTAAAAPLTGVIDVGNVGITASNQGVIGNAFSSISQPSCEYPLFSGGEHLYLGGIWVGARNQAGEIHVSTSAENANSLAATHELREFEEYEASGGPASFRLITNRQNQENYSWDALAPAHLEVVFQDIMSSPPTGHVPLGIRVTLRALAWSDPVNADYVIFDYSIENVSASTLYDVHVGFFNDTTVGNTNWNDPYDWVAPRGWNWFDDLNGGWRPGDFTNDPTLWMMHEHDADGDEGWATSWVGCRLLGTFPHVAAPYGKPPVSYNCWFYGTAPRHDDWKPDASDPETILPGKYQLMSNGHFDVGVTPEQDFTTTGNRSALLSTGPFPTLLPGESVRIVFAMVLGDNEANLRFNSHVAKLLYDYGYNPQIAGTGDVPPGFPALGPAVPNPFNPQTTIAFDLPKRAAVSLRVFDLSGRLVRVLVDGEATDPGRSEATWNGRDDTGRRVASGTYFYRLEAGEYSETKRMALIK